MLSHYKKGFTLVELMITIAIIGVLAAALYPSLTGYVESSRVSVFKLDASQTNKVLQLLMMEQGKSLYGITSNGCTDCLCRKSDFPNAQGNPGFNGNVKTVSAGNQCYDETTAMWRMLRSVSGVNFAVPFRDPWGGMYTIDENFGEFPIYPCRHDIIISAGNDNIRNGFDNVTSSDKPGILIKAGNDYAIPIDFPTTCQ